MLKDGIKVGEKTGADSPDGGGEQQKQHGAQQDGQRPDRGILEADDDGEHDDADDVIDDGGADDGGADPSPQVAHFPQGLHRNGDRGGGHDGADVDGVQELAAAGSDAVIDAEQNRPEEKRDKDADAGDEQGGAAGLFQLGQVGIQPGAEHQQDDADLRHAGEEIRLGDPAQYAGADDQPGKDLPDDLRGVQPAGQQAEGFGGKDDNGKVTADRIGRHRNITGAFCGIFQTVNYYSPLLWGMQEKKKPKVGRISRHFWPFCGIRAE